jgi:hypothetical protein
LRPYKPGVRPSEASRRPDDYMEIEAGDVVEVRRLLLEAITVEHRATEPPAWRTGSSIPSGGRFGSLSARNQPPAVSG